MSEREFELYLSLMGKLLRLGPKQTAAIADELRDHFDERFEALCRQGVPRHEAIRQALDEFGDAAGLASDFTQLARTRRRRLIMRCTLATVFVGASALFVVQALTPPNPLMRGPLPAQAQADDETAVKTLDVPEPEPPANIDPATFVPEPLAKKLTWEFTDLPLSEMLEELSQRIEMPILVDVVELNKEGIPVDEPVSDRLQDVPAYLLLERLRSSLELDWYVEDGILFVTSVSDAENLLSMQTYVISDLREAGYEPDALINLLQLMTSGSWQDVDGIGGTLSLVGDVLFVRQTARMHREIAGLLHALRNHGRETEVLSPPSHQEILKQLEQQVTVEFVDVPLKEAVRRLRDDTGVDIHIDVNSLTDVGVPTDEPITFQMTDKPLRTVLKYMLQPLGLVAIPDLGRLLITSIEVAENRLEVVLHDVSDVCQSKEETELLAQAVTQETEGPWEDIDGIGGKISVPVSGIMAVRQTEKVLREVRDLLAAYRRAVEISQPGTDAAAESKKIETRYYRMNAEMARDLQTILPRFVKPGTWLPLEDSPSEVREEDAEEVGEITLVTVDPNIEGTPPDTHVVPQAVMIIKHTKAAHQEIERFLNKVRHDDNRLGVGGGGFF